MTRRLNPKRNVKPTVSTAPMTSTIHIIAVDAASVFRKPRVAIVLRLVDRFEHLRVHVLLRSAT